MKRQLMWFRCDLRVHDNSALHAAAEQGPVLALYLLTPEQWQRHDDSPNKVDFWLRNLHVLRDDLARLNIPLLLRTVPTWDLAADAVLEVCRTHAIAGVQINEEYGIHESRRDQRVRETLAAAGIGLRSHLDQLLFAPGSLLTRGGSYFQVFSQFRKLCYQRLASALPGCLPAPHAQAPLGVASDPLPSAIAGFAPSASLAGDYWPAGEAAALARLAAFAEDDLASYHDHRDRPDLDGTSRLSPYLAAGVLSPRQCLHAALAHNLGEFDSGNPGAVSWINELLWREFYKHILVGYPRVSRGRAFRLETEALPWRRAPDDLAAWQQGRTGFPIVDAAMRQLLATGWMHNRLRMLSAMFLSKNLLIDWREGERWFMRQLIDGDLAANNGGWQWSASTGTDAAPYFRLFNPIAQSRRFDPKGRFLRRWLPELAHLDDDAIHEPSSLGLFARADYPAPMLDLGASRERVLSAFRELPKGE